MVQLTINGKAVTAEAGTTVLEATRQNQVIIPSLCWLEGVHQVGACRICVVDVEGARTLQAACMLPVRDGMVVRTNTTRVRHARRVLYELMLSDHPQTISPASTWIDTCLRTCVIPKKASTFFTFSIP